jgi:para-nitrobenzyl esterase
MSRVLDRPSFPLRATTFLRLSAVTWGLLSTACGSSFAGAQSEDGGRPSSESSDASSEDSKAGARDDASDSGAVSTHATTADGELLGIVEGATVSFRGIPYASPPVGALRWARPTAPAKWSGVRDATTFGNFCPQFNSAGTQTGDEDCLFVNVWTPTRRASSPLPVIFFIHGGDWIDGASSYPAYDGSLIAEAGPAVVVSLNYRLGALGFLALQDLAAEDPNGSTGNYGLLDQLAALGWAQANIAAFGGDPARVTMWGQSAGGWSTLMHLASPLGRGLFARAFSESGGTWARTLATSESEVGSYYATTLGCANDAGAGLLACLRGIPGPDILLAAPSTSASTTWGPVIDGYVLTEPVTTTFAAGRQAHVPLLLGTTSREYGSAGLPATPSVASVTTLTEYEAAVAYIVGTSNAPNVLALYPASSYASPQAAYIAMLDDWGMLCPMRRVARAFVASQTEPVWRYLYSHTDSNGPLASAGPVHASDLPFWFGTFPSFEITPDSTETALSKSMAGYLTRFAATANPNGDGAVDWPTYVASTDPYLGLANAPSGGAGIDTSECNFWDDLP